MVEIPRYVVDASVAIKWHLLDEQDVGAADALLTDYRSGRIQLIAPRQIRYEVANAIRTAVHRGRIDLRQGRPAIAEFLALKIPTVDDDDLLFSAYDLAITYDCALYDGLYLALASTASCSLVFADHRLRNSLGGRFPWAVWLTDYVPLSDQS